MYELAYAINNAPYESSSQESARFSPAFPNFGRNLKASDSEFDGTNVLNLHYRPQILVESYATFGTLPRLYKAILVQILRKTGSAI